MSFAKVYFELTDRREREGFVWSSFILLLVVNSLLFALVFAFSNTLSTVLIGSPKHSELIVLSFGSVSLSGLIVPFASYLKLEQKAFTVVSLALIEVISASALSLYFVIDQGLGVKGPLLGQLVAQGGLFFLFLGCARQRFSLFFKKEFWDAVILGLPYMFSFLGTFLIQTGTRTVLVELKGLEEGGIFFIAQNCAKILELFVMGMMAAWLPLFARIAQDREQSSLAIKKVICTYGMVISVPILGALFFAKPLLEFLVPPPLSSAWNLVGVLVLSQGIFGFYAIMQPLFIFEKKTFLQIIFECLTGVVGALFALLLIPYFGGKGAAFAQLISSVFLVFISLWLWKAIVFKKKYVSIIPAVIQNLDP